MSKQPVLTAMLCTLLVSASRSQDRVQECAEQEPLLSGNSRVLSESWSLSVLNASSALGSVNEVLLVGGQGWCSEPVFGAMAPWVEAIFPHQVRLEAISITGGVGSSGHVTSFFLQYGDFEDNNDLCCQCSRSIQGPMVLPKDSVADAVYNVTLSPPLVTSRLRLLLYSWTANPPCLRLELYGCASDEEPSNSRQPTCCDGSDGSDGSAGGGPRAVEAGVSATVGIILMLAAATTAVGVVCCYFRRARRLELKSLSLQPGAVHYVPSSRGRGEGGEGEGGGRRGGVEQTPEASTATTVRYMDNTLYCRDNRQAVAAPLPPPNGAFGDVSYHSISVHHVRTKQRVTQHSSSGSEENSTSGQYSSPEPQYSNIARVTVSGDDEATPVIQAVNPVYQQPHQHGH